MPLAAPQLPSEALLPSGAEEPSGVPEGWVLFASTRSSASLELTRPGPTPLPLSEGRAASSGSMDLVWPNPAQIAGSSSASLRPRMSLVGGPGGELDVEPESIHPQTRFGRIAIEIDAVEEHSSGPSPIPPDEPAGVWFDFPMGAGTVSGVQVQIDATHPDISQLWIELVHPDGQRIVLFAGNGTGADMHATFIDGGGLIDIADPPHTGQFAPREPLGRLFGKPSGGTWRLWIQDAEPSVGGSITDAKLRLSFSAESGSGSGLSVVGERASALHVEITSLHYPSHPVEILAAPQNFWDTEIDIAINARRQAKCSLSIYDPALGTIMDKLEAMPGRASLPLGRDLDPYATMLRVWHWGHCVFWGPIVKPDWGGESERVVLNAVDPGVRMEQHQARFGDYLVSPQNVYGYDAKKQSGSCPVNFVGVRLLRDCANNTAAQNRRGVPNLGIRDGINTHYEVGDDPGFVDVKRGDEVWQKMTELIGFEGAPDVEIEPIVDSRLGNYAKLNTYFSQGVDKRSRIIMHYGFGRDNLADYNRSPGGKIVTHQHEVSQDAKTRVTRANKASSLYHGIYVAWDPTDLVKRAAATQEGFESDLGKVADEQLKRYSVPPRYSSCVLKQEDSIESRDAQYRYLRDFGVGDVITTVCRKGYMFEEAQPRITAVKLKQRGNTRNCDTELTLVPAIAGLYDSEDT